MQAPLQLTGIGLREPHYAAFLEKRHNVAWLEVHTENYFGDGGKHQQTLETLRHDYPISLHGMGLSLGSADELNWQYLKKLKDLIARVNPCLVSDHLSWSSIDGQYLHELLPLPYTPETVAHVVTRIQQVQDYLQCQILIENIASYIRYENSTMTEWEFLNAVALQSGCGIVLDISNIYLNATNFGFNPDIYLAAINPKLIQEFQLGGFSSTTINEKEIFINSHNKPIVPAVWNLYQHAIQLLGRKATIIEWDNELPSLDTLCLEAYRAEKILRESYAITKHTA
jgi:uncharacterized protein (UPF0276 family)